MTRVGEVAVFTDGLAACRRFYEQVTGTAPAVEGDGIAIFALDGGVRLLLHARTPPVPGGPPNEDHLGLTVADLDAACAGLRAAGLALVLPPTDLPWGRSAYLRDPDGRLVELSAA